MSTTELIELIEKLSPDKQKVVESFVHKLIVEAKVDHNEPQSSGNDQKKLKREYGSLKGFVTFIADDFDAPLDDFKEYM